LREGVRQKWFPLVILRDDEPDLPARQQDATSSQ
jgi:hypothetical protein